MDNICYIAVYGTLRSHEKHEMYKHLLEHCSYVGLYKIHGDLYNVGEYPGLVKIGISKNKAIVELYKIRDESYSILLKILDDYEECGSNFPKPCEYERVLVDIPISNMVTTKSWIYEYKYPTDNLVKIKCGDYLKYLSK